MTLFNSTSREHLFYARAKILPGKSFYRQTHYPHRFLLEGIVTPFLPGAYSSGGLKPTPADIFYKSTTTLVYKKLALSTCTLN
jgi:hypothetical protein